MDGIAVSVICNAYNHASYIRMCLESLVNQKTNFEYEILVHDDASTDGTDKIIREFENRYPHLIKPIYQIENQYSRGGIKDFQYTRVKGKYIAFCEGDDYWNSEYKLQKQYDLLEKNPDIDICAHGAFIVDAKTGSCIGTIEPVDKDSLINVSDVIYGDGGFVATNSLMYRAKLNKEIPPFRNMLFMDYTLQIHGSLKGGMLYLSEIMSTYRFMTPGSWSERTYHNEESRKSFDDKKHKMLRQLDIDTNGLYHNIIIKKINKDLCEYYMRNNKYSEVLKKQYKDYYSELPIYVRIIVILGALFPWIIFLKRKLQASMSKNNL